MNPFRWGFRAQFLLGFVACAGLLAYAIYVQLHLGLEPCPLCIFQRIAFAALAVVFLLGALHGPRAAGGRKVYGVLGFIAAGVGMGIAARHVWVQIRPKDMMSSCGPPLSFLSETMGPFEVFRTVLTGTGDCGNIDWRFLGLSMPMWSMVWFVALALWALYAGFKARRSSVHHH
ncbi:MULTISPECIES: disulfide bond formation protein B [unclassified Xanthomonas]|uniref:Disulfide bond formation protein B n=1 Tax=Xanthomonas sp. 10-10 TaxID=3115848 RepID=A0AAU7PCJ2_9XANT|nr:MULTISPECIES: disulfide bond formation protein B [unclassified Xanthomonas]MCS3745705.1 disulfide bond formation protein DsbB [Xanthomonas sp. 3793]MCS3809428.1 disulfide bond formation protein DsbB [Xanthomonas sp. 4461]